MGAGVGWGWGGEGGVCVRGRGLHPGKVSWGASSGCGCSGKLCNGLNPGFAVHLERQAWGWRGPFLPWQLQHQLRNRSPSQLQLLPLLRSPVQGQEPGQRQRHPETLTRVCPQQLFQTCRHCHHQMQLRLRGGGRRLEQIPEGTWTCHCAQDPWGEEPSSALALDAEVSLRPAPLQGWLTLERPSELFPVPQLEPWPPAERSFPSLLLFTFVVF